MITLILALIAFLILYKFSTHLGQISEEEKKSISEKIKEKVSRCGFGNSTNKNTSQEPAEKLVGSISTANQNQKYNPANEGLVIEFDDGIEDETKKALTILQTNLEEFVYTVKSSFEKVLKSFAANDLSSIVQILSPSILSEFELAIKQREANSQKLVTNLILLEKIKISTVRNADGYVQILVRFFSKQINYVLDDSDNIILGQKDKIVSVTDSWLFNTKAADTKSNKVNKLQWIISSTN